MTASIAPGLSAALAALLRALDSPDRARVWTIVRSHEDGIAVAALAAESGIEVRRLARMLAPLVDAGLAAAHGGTVRPVPGRLAELAAGVERTLPLVALVERQPRLAGFVRHGVIDLVPGDADLREELLDAVEDALPEIDGIDEPALNALLAELARDVPLVRRWLVDTGRLRRDRDGTRYRGTPRPSLPE